MYLLQQVYDFENCEQVQTLFSDLPQKPYCTNAKGYCHIRPKSQAIKHAYIQPNHPAVVHWLVFDLDFEQALFAYYDENTPRPQLIVKNPSNGHTHYCFRLHEKVGLWGKSSKRAVKYLDAVYNALQRKLGADLGYSGNLVKNPAHSNWQTYTTGAKKSYTLDELAEYLDLEQPQTPQADNDSYFGRNCAVFHATRVQAYPIAHKYDYKGLYSEILAIAIAENLKFNNPLYERELEHIAKSITRFCKSARFGVYSESFIEKQRKQGQKGGLASDSSKGGLARSVNYENQRQRTLELFVQGRTITQIAKELGCHRNSISNWLGKL